MLFHQNRLLKLGGYFYGKAYIAGQGEGIVTRNGKPASLPVFALTIPSLAIAAKTWSFPDGTYVLSDLDKNMQYIVLAYDPAGDYEPAIWSHITPYSHET
ncbi:MAG: hypothetical protein Q4B82_07325 [Alysiella sp.]|uniref:hypothetical protein n=1 Tax=Alysiella sp. TaxID=1872483 RepID=UPI0026DAEC06|nr:hypothetical protein [Alysiella sp.]MDO4434372.1 hypothetical protein [Alysiella sp.]